MIRRRGCWRLIIDPPADGAWNMAVDEAILDSLTAQDEPTLRIYGWRPAALSLGKAQAALDPAPLRRAGVEWVRRPTGGWAVLHEDERTYAVIGSLEDPVFGAGVLETYRRISQVLVDALGSLGIAARATTDRTRRPSPAAGPPQACFTIASTHEILDGQRKLVGSAQLRRVHAFLQHGSIPLRQVPGRLESLLGESVDDSRSTDLESALGRTPSLEEIDEALCSAFSRGFRIELVRGGLRTEELVRATRLRAWKHLSLAWVREGKQGRREAAHGPLSEAR